MKFENVPRAITGMNTMLRAYAHNLKILYTLNVFNDLK